MTPNVCTAIIHGNAHFYIYIHGGTPVRNAGGLGTTPCFVGLKDGGLSSPPARTEHNEEDVQYCKNISPKRSRNILNRHEFVVEIHGQVILVGNSVRKVWR